MPRVDTRWPLLRQRHVDVAFRTLGPVFDLQKGDVAALGRLPSRWDRRLSDAILPVVVAAATEAGSRVARAFGFREAGFDPDVMLPWLTENAWWTAAAFNDGTREHLEDDPVDDVYELLMAARLVTLSDTLANSAVNFGAHDAAAGVGAGVKVWQVNSANPRDSHSAMSGASAPLGGVFSNGMKWPGDPVGGAEEVANCQCSLTFL
jgi:hypothetical protein